VGFAGPYIQSPSSAFGHLFLLVKKMDRSPLPRWSAYSYAAPTGDDGPFSQLSKGVFGGYSLHQDSVAFEELLTRYRRMETRSLRLLSLRTTPEERRRLVDRLRQRKSALPSYFFFQVNCASAIQDDLHAAMPDIPASGGIATSPVEVVDELLRADRVVQIAVVRPLSEEYREVFAALPDGDRNWLTRSKSPGFNEWDSLDAGGLHARWLEWRLQDAVGMRTGTPADTLPPEFYDRLVATALASRRELDTILPGLGPHAPGRWSIGASWHDGEPSMIGAFRLGLHDGTDFSPWYEGAGFLEMTSLKVVLAPEPNVLEWTIVHQKNRPGSIALRPGLVWSMAIAGGRDPVSATGPIENHAVLGIGAGWVWTTPAKGDGGIDLQVVSGASAMDSIQALLGVVGEARASWTSFALRCEAGYQIRDRDPGFRAGLTMRRRLWQRGSLQLRTLKSPGGWRSESLVEWDWSRP